MFRGRKLINNNTFSNNHQCNYTKTISCLRRREYRRIVTETIRRLIVKYLSTGFALNFIAAFWSFPGQCPKNRVIGICVVLPGACYSDGECVEKFGELYKCCPSGCNKLCKKGM